MPRVNLAQPPINWLRAAILERMSALDKTQKDLADYAGVSYDSMRQLMTRDPWSWPDKVRRPVCKALGIKYGVFGAPE